jgi:uncharacterized alpha-E superfamily protein
MLLCRLAESTFWLARYLERAEDLARALLVWEQLRLDMAGRETPGWQALGPLAGVAPDEAALLDRRSLVARIILDRESFSSVLGSLSRARENLRVTRSLMPSECWHTLNALYLRLERLAPEGPPAELGASLAQVVASAQQLAGQVAAAMLRDESYAFLRLGIYLERADMTLRIAIAIAEELIPADQPRYHARAEFANVVDLLLIEPAFPRSLAHALQQIGREIEGLPANEAPRAALRAAASVHAPSNRAGWLQLAEVALADLANLSTVLGATYFAPTLAAPSAGADGVRARPARTTGLVQSNQSPDSEVAQT